MAKTLFAPCGKIFTSSFIFLVGLSTVGLAQTSNKPLEREIKEFIQLAEARKAPGSEITEQGLVALKKEAASLLMREEVAAEAPYSLVRRLLKMSRSQLSEEERKSIAERLQIRTKSDDVVGRPFRELDAKFDLIMRTSKRGERDRNRRRAAEVVAEWVDSKNTLDGLNLSQLNWCTRHLTSFTWQMRSVRVVWEGMLAAPRTGDYIFSVSPFDINYEQPGEYNHQSMKVLLGGEVAVDAKLGAWNHVGNSITLSEGQQVPLRVEFEFEISVDGTRTSGHPFQVDRSPCAMLFWKGPGIKEAIVPASVFSQPEGVKPGLLTTYKIRYRGGGRASKKVAKPSEITRKCVEANIDHAWVDGRNFICVSPETQQRLCDEICQRTMAPQYWDDCNALAVSPPEKPAKESSVKERERRQHRLLKYTNTSALLSSSQRAEFLATLLNYPALIEKMSMAKAYAVYTRYWYGAPDEAIALLGTWMQLHPDARAQLSGTSKGFYRNNRWKYRQITIPTVMQYPEHFQVLLEEYLEMPDGGCCLPAAYSLGYGHLVQDRMSEWIELLDAKLADESLSGDRRVNWLLARAHAEEIRRSPNSHYYSGRERIAAGNDWIVEASLVAESSDSQLRIAREQIARLTALQQWDSAELAVGEAVAGEQAKKWSERLVKMQENAAKRAVKQKRKAQDVYLAELKRRQKRAADRGDVGAEERYSTQINSLESALKVSEEEQKKAG